MKAVAYVLLGLSTLAYAQTPYDPSDWIDRADLSDPEKFVLTQNQIHEATHEVVSLQRFNKPINSTIEWGEHSYTFRAVNNPELLSLENILMPFLHFIYLLSQAEPNLKPGSYSIMERDLLKRGFTESGISSLRKKLTPYDYSLLEMANAKLDEQRPENIARIMRDIEKGIPVTEEEYIARWNHEVTQRKQITDQFIIELLSMLNLRDRHILLSYAIENRLSSRTTGSISKSYKYQFTIDTLDPERVAEMKESGVLK